MIREIIVGYLGVLRALAKAAALVAACLACGVLIVWPLWYLATSNPSAYTALFCAITLAIALALALFAAARAWKKDRASFLIKTASVLTLAVGLSVSVALVLSARRLPALAVAVLTLFAYGFLAFALAPKARSRANKPAR